MDRDTNENNNKQIKDNPKQNLVHKGGQAAATYFGGTAGKAAYDAASKTDVGQKLEKAVANKIPSQSFDNSISGLNKSSDLSKKDGLFENNNFKTDNNRNNDNSKYGNYQDLDSNEVSDEVESLILKFKKLPSAIKGIIFTTSGFFITVLTLILIVAVIAVQTTAISETLFELMSSAHNSLSNFFDDASNYFASIEDSKIEKAEKAYYKKLQDVYEEFKRKYNVEIDTTMITATLFYGRTIGDYGDEEGIEDIENSTDISNPAINEDIFYEDESVEFYKLAKRHIKTLAKYMLIENTTFNACVKTESEELKVVKPATFKEIADNWSTISSWKDKNKSIWNTINNFNYVVEEKKTYTDANGIDQTLIWCNYNDAQTQLHDAYKKDKLIYAEKKEKYNICVETARRKCYASCPACQENPRDCSEQHACQGACNARIYNEDCDAEKAAKDLAYKYYYGNWIAEGLYSEVEDHFNQEGEFTCKETSKWGHLETYADESKYMNHSFDTRLVEVADKPDFLSDFRNYVNAEKNECSGEPAISYNYMTDISEEGVYYFKLMAKTKSGIFDFIKDDSFIERYYPELIDTTTEETREKTLKRVVDNIFLLYDTVVDREYKYCYTPSNSTSNNSGVISGSTSGTIDTTTQGSFYNSIVHDVIRDMENTGILASVTMAQASIESSNGRSPLAKNYNNYFGITSGCDIPRLNHTNTTFLKAGEGNNTCSGNAFWNGDVVWSCNAAGNDCQWYRVYDSFSNSVHDHSLLLSSGKYSCQGISDPRATLECIQRGGYAKNPNYIENLMGYIAEDNLTQFDIGQWNGETITDYSGNGLGTICYTSAFDRDLALGNQVSNGEGTINGLIGDIRTQLYGTPEFEMFWKSNNNLFYASRVSLMGECTWYAHGRGLEILTRNGMSLGQARQFMNPMNGNATTWFERNKYFSSSTNVNEPKPGAIIVWGGGKKGYGHVAIIEKVNYDGAGNPISVDISHGGQSVCQTKNGQKVCGFDYTTKDMKWVKSHYSYNFKGYVYLLG